MAQAGCRASLMELPSRTSQPQGLCSRLAYPKVTTMNSMSSDNLILLVVILAIVMVGLGIFLARRQRSIRLRRKYGAEYDHTVARHHSRAKAEAELLRREEHVARLKIVPLSQADSQRYARQWEALQSRFVDDPRGSVIAADQLVQEVM